MRATAIVAAGLMLSLPVGAQAGYVASWVASKGGCRPGVLRLLDGSMLSFNERAFLDKPIPQWTEDDFEDYRQVFSACARQYPAFVAGITDDPGNVKINRFIDERVRETYAATAGRAKQERERTIAAETAQRDMARAQSAARRENLMEEARRAREKAESAQKLADEEAPLIADAQRQYAEAAKARDEAEQRLKAVRERTQTQQWARVAEDENRMAAEAEQRRIETDARARSEVAALAGKPCRVTQEQFDRVRYGMNLQQVQTAFGCLGRQSRGFRIEGLGTYTTYVFEGMNEASVISVTLRGSSLEKKEQIGLF